MIELPLRLINSFAKRSCSHRSTAAAMSFLAVEQMVSSLAAAYPRVSKSGLKRTFLPECYRQRLVCWCKVW